MNEQNIPRPDESIQSSKHIWITIVAVVITTIIVGSGIYAWQKSNLQSTEQSLQQQITDLQRQITNLQKPTQPIITTPEETQEPIQFTNETTNWKTYSSSKYGFDFKYPSDLVITSISTEGQIVLANSEEGHWLLTIKVENNSGNLTLSEIVSKEIKKPDIFQDITLDGKMAKKYSIANFGDYGNAGIILISGNNIVRIYGDDSTSVSKEYFEALLSTFKFSK